MNSMTSTLKTSEEWYRECTEKDIMDADGWKNEKNPDIFWYSVPITYKNFILRMSSSTTVEYNVLSHESPFIKTRVARSLTS